MKQKFGGWDEVSRHLRSKVDEQEKLDDAAAWLNAGQRASLRAMAERLPNNGVILADEVGMGKTRIAVAVAHAVVECGGRVAILLPPGLGYQWQDELGRGQLPTVPPLLRSLWAYFHDWQELDPWFEKPVLTVSHAFTNWRLGDNPEPWRRALLPELYALWRKQRHGRLPRYYKDNEVLDRAARAPQRVRSAAQSIVDGIPAKGAHPGRTFLNELIQDFQWDGSLDGNYGKGTELRKWLEQSVGLGLGVFDLVIIDEAHKSRGDDSGLSRLIDNVIFRSQDPRRLCMTATPVELDVSQWLHTLGRIGLSENIASTLETTIQEYAEAAKELRRYWFSSVEIREKYKQAAKNYQQALTPYVLRRDKREDESVKRFGDYAGLRYRDEEKQISIEVGDLSPKWQRAVFAGEALSFASRLSEDPVAKRLRLTVGSGHGIATMLDQALTDKERDKKQLDQDQENASREDTTGHLPEIDDVGAKKRADRIKYWRKAIADAFVQTDDVQYDSLYDHPAIHAAIEFIEEAVKNDEKVLVFGRFTRPMRALTELLNARAMLRALDGDKPWPQTRVRATHDDDSDLNEWPAIRAAIRQLRDTLRPETMVEATLDDRLERQYNHFENKRTAWRGKLVANLRQGLAELSLDENDPCQIVFRAFENSPDDLPLVSRALTALSGTDDFDRLSTWKLAEGFRELIVAAMDREDPDADQDGDGTIDDDEAHTLWENLRHRITQEYSPFRGGFARFMYGGTRPETRRMIQLAFNRKGSFPKVLVAQSMVGREGLNLHKACRIVVMLHPEWNPGVAEQQIGRVDRVGSHWCEQLEAKIKQNVPGDQLPRIEVRPVIFHGTYDEHNWQVLRERWDDLRAQLHGIVVPSRVANEDEEAKRIIQEITDSAPDFSPSRRFGLR